jgi:N-acetyl-alpha-D-muramate 1-phosphate uridylyltransferase
MKINSAMIFAAGLGTRMRPITLTIPKPMVTVAGKPLLEYRIEKLKEYGVKNIVVNTFYLPDIIEDYLKENHPDVTISRETERLETGGGFLKAMEFLNWNEPVFVINSDVIWLDKQKPALESLASAWNNSEMDALLLLNKVSNSVGYHGSGDFNLMKNGDIKWIAPEPADYVFTGISIMHPRILNHYKEKAIQPFSLSGDVFKKRLDKDKILKGIQGIEHVGYWLHIDSVESLKEAEAFLAA